MHLKGGIVEPHGFRGLRYADSSQMCIFKPAPLAIPLLRFLTLFSPYSTERVLTILSLVFVCTELGFYFKECALSVTCLYPINTNESPLTFLTSLML